MTGYGAVIDGTLGPALAALAEDTGLRIDGAVLERFQRHLDLVRTWNRQLGLVSAGDVEHLAARHLLDALSLIPLVLRFAGPSATCLDIGSGGGFPAIPIKCALPAITLTIIERNVRKVGFLQKVTAAVNAGDVAIVHGSFPEVAMPTPPDIITARAVERPERVVPEILDWMPAGCAFLCQTTPPPVDPAVFHVEHIQDRWRREAWRRGELYAISRS